MSRVDTPQEECTEPTALYGPLRERVRLRGMRGAIASSMMNSLHGSAQLTLHRRFDSAGLVQIRSSFGDPKPYSFNDLILSAVARVLPDHPALNATVSDGEIYRWKSIHLGMAVSVGDGLVVPVIRDADSLCLAELSKGAARLGTLAKDGKLSMSDLSGATFTVSNLGAFGVDGFTPIINPPQAAILGIGRLNGADSYLSLTIDHRAVDGAPGGLFLSDLASSLEDGLVSSSER